MDCLEAASFNFVGAQNVTNVSIQHNTFRTLPEALLHRTPALLTFMAQYSTELKTLPEQFFHGQSSLEVVSLASSAKLGADPDEQLPDALFAGLTRSVSATPPPFVYLSSC